MNDNNTPGDLYVKSGKGIWTTESSWGVCFSHFNHCLRYAGNFINKQWRIDPPPFI